MLMGRGIRITKEIFFAVCLFTFASGRVFPRLLFARSRAEVECLSLVGGLRFDVLVFKSHSAYWIFGFHLFLLVLSLFPVLYS